MMITTVRVVLGVRAVGLFPEGIAVNVYCSRW